MRFLAASIVIGPLVLIGALPAAAVQPTAAVGVDVPVQLAATGNSFADRDTYAQRARDDMQQWQRKLHDFGDTVEAKGKEAATATERELNAAWTRTEAASRQLQTVGDEGWESAKTSYEKASHDLAVAWHKFHPEDK